MSNESRRMAGVLLIVLPTVMIGGVGLLSMLFWEPAYAANPLRQNLWRAGHAHAGVLLILRPAGSSLRRRRSLSEPVKQFVRLAAPSAAILLSMAFFLSVLTPEAHEPNGLIYLAYVGAAVLAAGVITLGVGLFKKGPQRHIS